MYIIIGGDQKQYGPISAEDMRKWVAEGRLNAQSLVKGEGDAEFRPLGGFPEFVDALAAATGRAAAPARPLAPQPVDEGNRLAALDRVKLPAIFLIITASLGILYYLFNTVYILSGSGAMFSQEMPANMPPEFRSFYEGMQRGMHGPLAVAISLFIVALNGFVLFGAIKMLRLQNHTLALVAAIVAMLPCHCCCVLSLPFGIWALVVLNNAEVKSQFT